MLFKKSQEEVNPPSNHSTLLPQAPRHTRTKGKIAALCGEHGLVLHSLGNSGLLGWGTEGGLLSLLTSHQCWPPVGYAGGMYTEEKKSHSWQFHVVKFILEYIYAVYISL